MPLAAPTASAQSTPTVSLSVPADTEFAEGDGNTSVTVTATLSAAQTANTVVDLTLGGTAKSTDYTVVQLPDITITAGQTVGTAVLTLNPVDDIFFEGDETVSIGGKATGVTVNAIDVSLVDDDVAPTLTLKVTRVDSNSLIVDEGESAHYRVAVTLVGGTSFEADETASLSLIARPGFELVSSADIDYETAAPPWSLKIPAGRVSAHMDVKLTVVDDTLTEPIEFASLRVSVTVAGTTISFEQPSNEVFLWIPESDQPLRFSVANDGVAYPGETVALYPLVEGGTTARAYSVTVSWGATTLVSPSSKVFAVGAGMTGFLSSLAHTFTIDAGAAGRRLTYSVTVSPDDEDEAVKSGSIEVYPAADGSHEFTGIRLNQYTRSPTSVGQTSFTFLLTPNAPRPVEPVGTAKRMEVVLDSGVVSVPCFGGTFVSCRYLVQEGDFDFDGRIEIPAGSVKFTRWRDAKDTTVTGPVASPLPPNKRTLSIGSGAIYGGRNAIDLSVSPKTLQEGTGEQALTIIAQNRDSSATSADLVIPLTFTDVSTSPGDYSVRGPLSVTIPAGQLEGRTTAVLFTPTDDLRREARAETVRIEGSKGAMMTPFVRGAELTVVDAAGIALTVSPSAVAENEGARQVDVTATWADTADQGLPQDVEVALAWGGTAGAGDYTRVGGATVTIPANARSGATTATITPADDNLLEGDESIAIEGSVPGRTVTGAELTLTDDETVPAVTLSVSTDAVSESGAAQTIAVSATLDPDVAMANDVTTVTLALGGTATEGEDYSATWSPASRQISIPRLATAGSNTVALTLTPTDDSVAEDDETVVVQGTATTDMASRNLVVKVATIEITDDDTRGINLSPKTVTVAEKGTNTFEVWLGTQPTDDVTVTLSSTDAAIATVDDNELTFTTEDWGTRQTVTVTGVNDDYNNADDKRTAEIRHTASGGGYDGVAVESVEVTVTDDDEATSFSIGDASATEGQAIIFTVTRSGATGGAATVDWGTAEDVDGDHPASSSDYTEQAAARTLNFAAGETRKTVTVQTTQDTIDEEDETFLVELSSPSTGTSITDATATGTIADDDTATLTIHGATINPGQTATLRVVLSTASDRDVTVTATTSDDTLEGLVSATAGEDYTHKSETLTIAAGETETEFKVVILPRSGTELTQSFSVVLSEATVGIDTGTAHVTILGSSEAISVSDASAVEGGDLTFTITRRLAQPSTDPQSGSRTVQWTTGDDTTAGASKATAGDDYTAVTTARTVTFNAADTAKTITVTSLADQLLDGDETFAVTISSSSLPVVGGPGIGTITEGTTGYSVADTSADEGEDATVTIFRLGLAAGVSSVRWRDAADTSEGASAATAGEDYRSRSARRAEFKDGETAVEVTVRTLQDALDEDDETFLVVLDRPSGQGVLDDATATVTIADDDATPTVSVADAAAVTEGDDPSMTADMTFAVSVSAASGRTVTVPFTLGGTASAPADYALPDPLSVEIAAGQTGADIVVPIKGDVLSEGNETVTVTLGTPTNATVSTAEGAGTASGTIDDDDDAPSGIALSVDVTSLSEGAAETEVTVTASVSGGTTFAAAKTVRVTVGGGTSTATSGTGGDYTAVAPFDIVLNAGASSATAAFDLEPLDDTADELDETIEVTGAESGGATVSAATITLTDDDVPELGIAAGAAVIEGAAASFTVNADIAPAAALTVNLDVAATAGFAAAGTTGSQTLTFPAGRTSETYTVSTQGDTTDEPDGTVTVEVETGTGYTVASASDTASVAVEDDDATTVALGRAGTGGIAEDGGEVEVTVTLGRELVAGESVTVPLAVTGATVTTHYTLALKSPGGGTGATFSTASPHSAQNPAVTLAGAGARTATLVLTAVANTDIESRTVSIGYGTGARAPAGTGLSGGVSATGSLSVPVVDDDAMVTVAAASAAEGSAVAFTVTLPKPAPAGGVTVAYSTSNGRGVSADATYQVATSAADYTAAADGAAVTIAQGASSGTISIATTQDDTYEGDHYFTLTLASTSHFNLGTAAATGTIEDDADAPVFAFSAASTDADEDEDDGTVTLTVNKTGTTLLGATVSYVTKDGTAIGGSDFTAITSTSLAFAAADTSKAITVTVTDDSDDEPEEAFTVELSNPSDAQLGAPKSHSIAITDNDKTAVTLSAPAGDIAESGGSKVITVTLGRALTGTETLAVPLTFAGAATFGADYTLAAPSPVPTGVTYANLASTDLTTNPPTIAFSGIDSAAHSATVTLSAAADSTDEGASESVTVGIGTIATAPDGGASASGTATFNIADDDTATLGIDDASAAEGGTAAFAVGLSTPSDREVTVTATTSDGTATAGADYTGKTEQLTIAAGAATATFNVAIASDSENEIDETFTVTLSGATGAAIADSTATGTITGNAATLVSIADASAREGQSLTFNLTRTGDLSAESTVDWTTGDDTAQGASGATADTDYTAVTSPRTVTFAATAATASLTVTSLSDALVEGDETFRVNLAGPAGATLASAFATGTITEATTGYAVADASADEGEDLSFIVTRSGLVSGASTVKWSTADDTRDGAHQATAGDDYTATTAAATLSFAANETAKTITVSSAEDSLDEHDETFAVALSAPSAGGALLDGGAVGTIADDDATPTVSVADAAAVTEGDDPSMTADMTFAVSVSAASGRTVTVPFTLGGTASAPADYALPDPLSVEIAAGQTGADIVVPIKGDVLSEGNETVTVTLGTPTNATVSTAQGAGTASGTIDDDDDAPSGIALSVDVTSLSEGAAETEVTVTASVSGGTTFAAAKTVRVTVGGGTSTATSGTGGDYTAVAPFDIVLNAGASSATAAFDLEPLDDTADELDETIEVTGAESGGATVSAATITLTDDDVPELGIAAGAAVIEGAAASFTVNADIAPAAALTVNLDVAATAGFAAAGTTGSQTLTFPAGRTSETYTVSTQGDTTDEPDGTVTVEVETGTGYTVASASDTASVAVEDDDATTVALGRAGTGGIAEDGGEVEVTVTLGRELVAGESVTVPLAVTGATVTTHYTLALKSPGGGTGATFSTASPHSAQNPAVTLAGAGARTATLVLTAVANTDIESRTVSIGYGTGARAPAGTGLSGGVSATGSLSVPVVDDDAMVTVAAASAAEGSAVAFTVTLPKPAPAGGVTVAYSTSNGRGVSADATYQVATSAADYTAAADGAAVTIAQGASSGTISIATTQDDTYEGDHYFTLTLASTSHFNLGTAAATGTIEDDADAPVFAFSAASTDADEDEDDGTVTLTVNKTGTTLLGATVSYVTKDGTAIGGSDFTAITSTSLAFAAADTSKAITVTVTDDSDDEPEEAFTVELSNPSDAQLGAPKSHSIAITDNDKTAVTLSAPAGDIAESGGSKVITVTLGRALTGTETLAVPLTFAGAATFGADYTLAAPSPVPTGVTYANLASTDLTTNPPTIAFSGIDSAAHSATVTLSAAADSTDEGASESVTVGIGTIATAPDGGASASGTATFNIADDDTATLGIDDASAAEGGTAAFAVGLSTPSDREVTVTATTSDGTATAGADYTGKTEQLTIAAGAATATFNVAIASDSENEIDETFTVTLSGATGAAIADSTATGTITGNAATLVSIADASAREGQSLTFNLTRTGDLSAESTVDWTTGDDTAQGASGATADTDYTAVTSPRTVTFAATAATASLTVTSLSDALVEGDETFRVNLAGPAGATLASAFATGTITEATTGYAVADASADEGEDLSFIVTRSGLVSGASTVKWSTADDTRDGAHQATAGDDYTATTAAATLSFAANETAKTITVSSAEDSLDEHDETFAVALSAPSAGGALLDGGAVGTIADDDATPTVSVADAAAVTEGDDPSMTADMTFAVSVSAASGRTVTVPFTLGGTASAPADYALPDPLSVEIAAGQTGADIVVPIKGDVLSEGNETVTVTLGTPTNATVSTAQGAGTASGTIDDDDSRGVTVSPAGLSLAEADDPTTKGLSEHQGAYTVALTSEPTGTVTVSVASGDTSIATVGSTSLEFTPSDWDAQTVTVTAVADAADNAGDARSTSIAHTVRALGTDYDGVTATSVTVNVADDDGEPTLSVDAPSVAEGDSGTAALTFTVTLSPASGKPVSMAYADAATGSATSATDYAAITAGTLNFAAGDTSKTVNVSVNGDTLDESNETVKLRFSSPTNARLSGGGQTLDATGTIADDDDAPVVSIADATAEEGYAMTFTLRLDAASGRDVTVQWATADDADGSDPATADEDYTAVGTARTATIKAGATTATVTVDTLPDVRVETDETFLLRLSDPVNATLSPTASEATGTIADNQVPTLDLTGVPPKINDRSPFTATFTFSETVTGFVIGDVDVAGAAKGDFAGSGTEYTLVLTPTGGQNVVVTVPKDAATDGVNLTPSADVTETAVWDNTAPTVTIGDASAAEGDPLTFTVTLDRAVPGGLTVTPGFTDGTATKSVDYTENTAALAFAGAAGETQTFTVATTEDALAEDDETFAVGLTVSGTTVTVTATDTATGTIKDDDEPSVTVGWGPADETTLPLHTQWQVVWDEVSEGESGTFVLYADPAPAQDLRVAIDVTDFGGFLPPGGAGRRTVTIPAGATTRTVTVPTEDDEAVETYWPDSRGHVGLDLAAGPGYRLADPSGDQDLWGRRDAVLFVRDNDANPEVTVSFASRDANVEEGGNAHRLSLRAAPESQDLGPYWIGFRLSGTATPGVDYELARDPRHSTDPPLERSGNRGKLWLNSAIAAPSMMVTIFEDGIDDDGETVVVTLQTGAGYGVGEPATVTLTIGGSDTGPTTKPALVLSETDLAMPEGDKASYTVSLATQPTDTVTVDISGHAGTDLTLDNASLTFGTADWDEPQTVTVTAGQDDDAADDIETLELTASGGGYGAAAEEVTVTVTDDDQPALVVSETALEAPEGGSAEYSVRLATQPAESVTVAIAGHADTDLTLDKDSLTFGPTDWNDPQTVTVSAGQDDDASDDTATLVHTASGADYDARTAEVAVTVEDDDGVTTVTVFSLNALVLSETALAMTEGAGTSYAVSLATQPADTVTVEITGHAGTDLSLDRTSLTFGTSDWDAPQTVTVSAARDADEDEDTATLVHTATGGGYDGIAAELPVTVRDGIKISLEAGKAVEGSFMEVRFTLSSPSPGDVEVSWLTHPGGGSAHGGPRDDPDDFRMESGRLHFAAGETEIVREVWIVEDGIDDPHEQFTVQIDRPRGAVLADPVTSMPSLARPDRRIELGREIAYAVVTILQAEAAPEPVEVTLEAAPPTLEEGGRTLLWARLAEPLPEPVRIPLVWTERTAEPEDHDGPGGLTIYAGDLRGRATLNAFEDNDEDDETLSVSFGELPQWVVAGTPDPVEIAILDNDGGGGDFAGLTVSVADATVREGEANLRFPVTLSRPAPGPVTVYARIDPNAGTARRGADYVDTAQRVRFEAGDRLKFVTVLVEDDLIDEGEETLYLELSDAEPNGVTIARARATGTIRNTDPMPAAWLARFGRTVAEQALDGVAARIGASREPGWRGSLGGLPLGGGPSHGEPPRGGPPGGEETGAPKGPGGLSRLGGIADDPFGQRPGGFGQGALSGHGAAPGTGVPGGHGAPGACGAMGGVEPSGGPRHDAPPTRPGPSCAGPGGHGLAALTGTDFSLTGKPDAGGGTLAFWGRGARTTFGGREGPVNIDGEVSTGLLGADYASDRWLVGLALAHSLGDGAFAGPEIGSGEVASSLTAAIPYASLEASERLSLWGAAGYGAGEVTLEGGGVPAFAAGIDWAMAAAGARGGLFAPKDGHGGPALNVIADALWSRAGSEKTSDMVATASDVTRLRVGLEGSWPLRLPGGVELKPRLETGLRHDGGDAETGFGVELGGGLVWTDPRIGLSVDIAARTLLAHEAQGRTDRGLSASIAFDPDPSNGRGLSLSLKQDLGGASTGGLDALFAHEAPGRQGAFGGDAGRWTAEAAYGLPAFGDRFTATPHFGYGHSGTGREHRLGWRLEPADADALQLTFGIEITRREDTAGPPEHRIGAEIGVRW